MKTTSTRRPAFTLVEMLVVILIMSILVTLVTLGVTRAMRFASEVGTKTEMAQIEQALGVAALDLGRVPYIPSYLYLWDTPANAQNDIGGEANATTKGYKQMSLRMLKQMFPNWTSATWLAYDPVNNPNPAPRILTGSEAYVFILGGKNAIEGFHATNNDPWLSGGKRKGPYYNFKSDRLDTRTNRLTYRFKDYWNNDGSFLVVYSSQMVSGTPNPPFIDRPAAIGTAPQAPERQFQRANALYMPKGYQIFSAGKDGVWGDSSGSTGQYNQTSFNGLLVNYPTGAIPQSPPSPLHGKGGEDDQCNFSESPLGKPIND